MLITYGLHRAWVLVAQVLLHLLLFFSVTFLEDNNFIFIGSENVFGHNLKLVVVTLKLPFSVLCVLKMVAK